MKKLITLTVFLFACISAFAQQYYAQPYYGDNKIRVYNSSNPVAASPTYTIDLSADVQHAWGENATGPNDVVFYGTKMFVSFDLGDRGGVLIYNISDVIPTKTAAVPTVIKPQTANGLSSAGIVINPANGDLFVPTFYSGADDAGVYQYTASSNYVTGSQFASFYNDNSVAEICSNLTFDAGGNLWMTTWSADNDPTHHFLICYKGANKNNYYKITNTATAVYSATDVAGNTTTGLNLLSAPEGIGFDASGNLWLGNNNDDAHTNANGQGTLVEFKSAWISTLLGSPSTGTGAGNPTYSPAASNVSIKYISGGKEGGITFNGNTMYMNDQGQNQGSSYTTNGTVWQWDVTTAFNTTNFKASGIHTTYPGNGGGGFVPSATSNNAVLTSITTNSGVALTTVAGADYQDYAITVPATLTSITVTPTAQNAGATIKVNGTAVASGSASTAIPLAVGTTTINTVVTAQDGITTKTYGIAVTRPSSSAVQYYAQPYYSDNKIRVYNSSSPVAASPTYTIDLSTDVLNAWGENAAGPNDVVFYGTKMFVSFDLGDRGGVLIYNVSDVIPTKNATAPIVIKPQTANGLSSAGIAVNPANGDLFVPTFYAGTDAGVYQYTAASNYATGTQFSSYNNDNSVAQISSNLTFDAGGNLWMTTWSADNSASDHFLICYKGINKNNYYKITNAATASFSATDVNGNVVNGLNLLSAPEGIAFDPAGNLWLGNNNDFARTNAAGQGTLVEFKSSWISTLLSSPSTGTGAGNPTYSPAAANVNIKYIAGGKEGGITFNGNTMYLNDQGQNQGTSYTANGTVWQWDVTTAFNATNFKASGIHTTYPGNGGGGFVPSAGATNALLAKIATNSGVALTTVAGPDYKDYAITIPATLASITVTPTAQDATATIKVNGTVVASGTASAAIPLTTLTTTISIVVVAQDGVTTKTYGITVTRPSNNALLSKIATNSGVALTTVAGADYKDYAITVPSSLASITVTPTAQDATATIKVNGVTVASGTASQAIPLAAGTTTINTVVTAQDGVTTKTYGIAVTKAASTNTNLANLLTNDGAISPAFAVGTTSYTLAVANAVASITITPTAADGTETIKVNGTTVASGAASTAIALAVGSNTINTVVTAQDGVTTKTYSLTVTRAAGGGSTNALLSKIATNTGVALTTVAGADYRDYTITVPNATGTVKVTATAQDATATIKINGVSVASGTPSASIPLAIGNTVINTVVTAQDGVTTKTYGITITRLSNIATLSKLATNSGVALTAVAGADYRDYTLSLPNAKASITITPTATDATSTIKVNGTTVASGTASAAIALPVGTTTINTVVTSQDGSVINTYGIAVTRAAMMALYAPQDSIATDGLTVHPGITPNGDGINDIFTIDGINTYPDNKVTIMNRSGVVIYEAKGYDNQTKFFDGHSSKNGALQLAGTYFYSLEYLSNGKMKVKTGFIVLKY